MKSGAFSCAALLLASLSFAASPEARADAGRQAFERDIDWLKRSVLAAGVQFAAFGEAANPAGADALPVYVGSGSQGATVTAVRLTIDGKVIDRPLSAEDSKALIEGGLYRAASIPRTANSLRIELTMLGNPGAAAKNEQSDAASGTSTLGIDLAPASDASAWVVSPEGKGMFREAQLRAEPLHRLAAGSAHASGVTPGPDDRRYRIGDPADPSVRYARLLLLEKDDLGALIEVGRLQQQAQSSLLGPGYSLVAAEALAGYGLLDNAYTAYQQALRRTRDPVRLAAARLAIGDAWLRRGDPSRTLFVLGENPATPDKGQISEWNDLRSRALLDEGRYGEAAASLRLAANDVDFLSYLRYYNLGVGLLHSGKPAEGWTILDRIGNLSAADPLILALRDQANLSLGLQFLRAGQGASAVPALEKVGAEGRFSNPALLALGRSWLAPAGAVQRQVQLGDERTIGPPPGSIGAAGRRIDSDNLYQRYKIRRFAHVKDQADDDLKLEKALEVWSLLIDRDPRDLSVQEGLLAAAEAFNRLGAPARARELLERAVSALQAGIGQIHDSQVYFARAGWSAAMTASGTPLSAAAIPGEVVSRPVGDVLASDAFMRLLSEDRRIDFFVSKLNAWSGELDREESELGCRAARPENAAARNAAADGDIQAAEEPAADAPCAKLAALRGGIAPQLAMAQRLRAAAESLMARPVLEELDRQLEVEADMLGYARFELARMYDGVLPGDSISESLKGSAPCTSGCAYRGDQVRIGTR